MMKVFAAAIIACLALCVTNGLFAVYLTATRGMGFLWIAVVHLAPPIVALFALEFDRRRA